MIKTGFQRPQQQEELQLGAEAKFSINVYSVIRWLHMSFADIVKQVTKKDKCICVSVLTLSLLVPLAG